MNTTTYKAFLVGSVCCCVAATLTSCADDDMTSVSATKPERLAQYEYLDSYDALKTYVDRSLYPNFRLGAATLIGGYNRHDISYRMVNANFDEVVAGNAMKMGSCVGDDGSMDFSAVSEFVSTATEAGLTVYGHTLAWHAQQPVKWLGSLLADRKAPVDPNAPTVATWVEQLKNGDCEGDDATSLVGKDGDAAGMATHFIDGAGVDGSKAVKVHAIDHPANAWDTQFFIYTPDRYWQQGDKYRFTMKVRADKPAHISVQSQNAPSEYIHWTMLAGGYDVTTEWQEFAFEGTISGEQAGASGMRSIAFNLNELPEENNYYFDDMSWQAFIEPAGAVKYMADLIENGNAEGDDVSCFFSTEPATGGPHAPTIQEGAGTDGSRAFAVQSADNPVNDWDTQFFIRLPEALAAGQKYHVEFDYRADREGDADTQAQGEPSQYQHWEMIGSPHFTTEWQHWDRSGTISGEQAGANGMRTIAFNLAKNKVATRFYFDNIKVEVERTSDSGGIPLTDQEKRDTLAWAMEQWISGMMAACDGKVMAWDVVNESVNDGGPDAEGVYQLHHGNGTTGDFFWQDYMGDLDYVRTAVRLARQYGPEGVKLFVNDYNLESDWDQNGKLKSLIKWIERWEADGVTRIDGIGTQMHITCHMNPMTQESKKQAITEMLRLMAATGKLVRISELDMGLADENGNEVKTQDATEEQHRAMADLYRFVVSQYLHIVPASQQWGICQWSLTDSPVDSFWRAGMPIGLWDLDYSRKHTYAGFADGLKGK